MRELHSLEAEQAVVGGLMIDPNAFDKIDGELTTDMFTDPGCQMAFNAASVLHELGKPIDLITIAEYLEEQNVQHFNMNGGYAWLAELNRNTPSAANVKSYAGIVEQLSKERGLYYASIEIQNLMLADGLSTEERFQEAEAIFTAAGQDDSSDTDEVSMIDAAKDYLNFLDYRFENPGIHGLITGFPVIDDRLQGLKGGELYIIGARPAMGKTTYAMNIAVNTAINGSKVYIASLEMPVRQLTQRLFAYVGKIPLPLLQNAQILSDEAHGHKLAPALQALAKSSIKINDKGSLDVNELRSRCRKQKRTEGLNLVVVDYLQLMTDRTCKNRFEEISSISRKLKSMAKELDCAVIALSQLNRDLEKRPNKRPVNADLRESGQIEQDADVIQFLYRDEIYNEGTPHKGVCEIITTKMRDGEIGTDYLEFVGSQNMFKALEWKPEPIDVSPKKKNNFTL